MSPAKMQAPGRRSQGSGDVRQQNLVRILEYVRDHGPSSRNDIAQGCGLGVSTMTDLVGELRNRRLLRELRAVPRPGAGRPTRPIALDGEPWCVLGVEVDLVGLRFAASTVGGAQLWADDVAAPLRELGVEAGYAALRHALGDQLSRLPADRTLVAVQVALPGHVACDRGVVGWSDGLGWDGLPLRDRLEELLEEAGHRGVAVGIARDCHLAGLHAVRTELALPPGQAAAYLGGLREVGGGVVLDGKIYRGADGGAGDFGHLHVDPRGPLCVCGRHGCLESLVGPLALLTRSGVLTAEEAPAAMDHEPLPALRRLVERADAGDERVLAVLVAAGDALGLALDDIIGALNPHVVILGGYLGMLAPHLLGTAQHRIEHRTSRDSFLSTRVVTLEEKAPRVLLGAVMAARDACLTDPLQLTDVVLTA